MVNTFWNIVKNPVLVSGIFGYLFAQFLKTIWESIKGGRLTFRRMVGSGGMPSSHAATVSATAVAAGIECGFESGIFGLAVILAIVVMYDAAGVRRAAGEQAKIINDMVKRLFNREEVDFKELKELLGHKPTEVAVGCLVGIFVGLAVSLWIL